MSAAVEMAAGRREGAILSFDDYAREDVFAADVVVVGTGAGGAAAGARLAAAGRSVIFVEEGGHHPTSSFNPYCGESVPRLYRDGSATVIYGNPPIPYVEGRCVGGSTVINGGMAYRAPERVLDDWVETTGIAELGPGGMEAPYEEVEAQVGAAPQLELSIGEDSRIMMEGARRLGWSYTTNRRNQVACVGTNNCVMGCPTGAKQSTLVTYLPLAFAKGARCLTEVRIERLLVERGRCVGVEGRAIDPRTRRPARRVTVRGRAVVIACGAVQTPYLLLRHGLGRASKKLGENFLCHPNAKVLAVYDRDVEGWKGVSQNTQVRQFHDEGILFAENFVAPGVLAAYLPFHGDEAWELMRDYNRMAMTGVLVEDSRPGRVTRGLLGMALPRYDITPYDHARFKKGVRLLATLHFEMGAKRVILPFANLMQAHSVDELRKIDDVEKDPSSLELFTVHLMGTARMGSDPRSSVVGPTGEVWDLPGCYVADASLFPKAIGVNPQITIMALAGRVAERIALAPN